jgi:hypothetical protein
MEVIKKLDNGINSILSTLIREPTLIRGSIHLLLMLYAARIAPKLPDAVLSLFENQYFKLFVFALILWTAQFSPSTSILIAIAFMVSVNYANQKPLWEFMDGEIQLLEEETSAPETTTMAPETTTMAPETTTMAPEMTTMAPEMTTMAPATTTSAPETTAAVEAVVTLANAAASTTAVPVEQVIPVAQVAAAATTTPAGLQAVQALAEQAVVPAPTPVPEVQKAVDQAVESIVTPKPAEQVAPEVGCYPIRRYDMTKVSPQSDIQYGFESYQEFKA